MCVYMYIYVYIYIYIYIYRARDQAARKSHHCLQRFAIAEESDNTTRTHTQARTLQFIHIYNNNNNNDDNNNNNIHLYTCMICIYIYT